MEIKELKFKNISNNPDPQYKCKGDSGFDLCAWIRDDDVNPMVIDPFIHGSNAIVLKPFECRMIHTGLYFELPNNTEIQVRSRSGLAIKHQIIVINTPGTVDELYRGEVCVGLINLSQKDFLIENGDRIAQAVLMPVYNEPIVKLTKIEDINKNTERGDGGFGHTGTK